MRKEHNISGIGDAVALGAQEIERATGE